jgi:GMP synthase (glutamine-hydrolysing)
VLLPLGAQRLASSEKDANMAFFYPPCCWGVQFHPEYNEAIIAGYISEAALMLKSEGQDVNELLKNIQATSDCNQLLINFLRIISDQANPIAKKLLT